MPSDFAYAPQETKPVGYLLRWRSVVAPLVGILVATVMLLVALSGQAGAQVQAIAAGDQHALATGNSPYYGSGLVWGWGDDWYGQVGDNSSHQNRFPPARVVDPSGTGYLTGVQDVAAGEQHSLALMQDGSVYAWGLNDDCQLGIGESPFTCPAGPVDHSYVKRPTAVLLPSGSQMQAIAAGNRHSLAVRNDGTVWAWGQGKYGQLGVHSDNTHGYPVQVHGPDNVGNLSGITDVAAGRWHSLALKNDGTVWAWGDNSAYQLGTGSQTDHNTPVQVRGPDGVGYLTDVVAIAAGYDWNLAVKNDGTVWSWGDNAYGQLGVNSNNEHGYPVQVHGTGNVGHLSGITDVAAGERHSLAVKNDGTVYSWGGNNHGQLGVHSDNTHQYPVQVHGLNNAGYLGGITAVDAGEFFSMALNSAGTAVYAWGGNSYGQIDATLQDHSYPVQVNGVAGSTPPPKCGDTITTDTTLHKDLVNCPNNGILIGADNVTLDLNGHLIDGDGTPDASCNPVNDFCDFGVAFEGHDGITVKHGTVRQFEGGVGAFTTHHTRLLGVSAPNNTFGDIGIANATRVLVRNCSGDRSTSREGNGLGLFDSHHIRVLHSSFRHNVHVGIKPVGSTNTVIKGNLVARNGDEGLLMEGGERNRIRGNLFVRNGGGITLGPGSRNVITGNRVSGGHDGIRIEKGHGNLVAGNVVVHAHRAGIRLGIPHPFLGGANNVVRGNLVRQSRVDGFLVNERDDHSLLKGNTATGAGDDGFDVRSRTATLTRNRGLGNADLGIAAVRGVNDGGGNVARHNGDPRQCTHIVCH